MARAQSGVTAAVEPSGWFEHVGAPALPARTVPMLSSEEMVAAVAGFGLGDLATAEQVRAEIDFVVLLYGWNAIHTLTTYLFQRWQGRPPMAPTMHRLSSELGGVLVQNQITPETLAWARERVALLLATEATEASQ
jgi:hypothetical protein